MRLEEGIQIYMKQISTYALFFITTLFASSASSETINFIPPDHPQAARLSIKVSSEGRAPLPACVSLRNASDTIWGLDAVGKPLTYQNEPRVWISGDTVLSVTAGWYDCVVSRPFEYERSGQGIELRAGETFDLNVVLKRVVDMNALGWYAGDAHQHIVHGEEEFAVNVEVASRIAQAEGADWCSFNSAYSSVPGENPSLDEVREMCRRVSNEHFLALTGDEYPKDHLGHMACLPGSSTNWLEQIGQNEYEPGPGKREELAHFEILRRLRDFGGLSINTHPIREYGGTEDSPSNIARELPFDILCAPDLIPTVDWMTDRPDDPQCMKLWYMYLNWGYQIGVCAFTDTCYDRHDARPMNRRTYVYLGRDDLTQENIIDAIRRGRTFGTTGPLLDVTVDGQPPGTVFKADGSSRTLQVKAFAPRTDYAHRSTRPEIEKVEIIRNGNIVRTLSPKEPETWTLSTEDRIQEAESAWYIVKVYSSGENQVAISSPYYFRTADFQSPQPPTAKVKITAVDKETRTPLNGKFEIFDYLSDDSASIDEFTTSKLDGAEINCSPLMRIKALVEGYRPQTKSLFFDTQIYDEFIYPLRRVDQLDPQYYERLRQALQNLELSFELEK